MWGIIARLEAYRKFTAHLPCVSPDIVIIFASESWNVFLAILTEQYIIFFTSTKCNTIKQERTFFYGDSGDHL